MKEDVLKIVNEELRSKFDELIKCHNLDYKDEIRILAMLTKDTSKNLPRRLTIVSD